MGSIADRTVDAGQSFTVDVSSNFRDSDGDALTYAAESSDEGVATARAAGSQVNVEAVGPGTASVTVTASDPGGRTAAQSFGVSVRGSFGDDFGSAASLADWTERNNTGISVGGGVLSVTNRTQGRLGVAERASTPTLNSWMVAARMGRTTRKASPGVVSVTGHRRFTAARLVLRTIDDSGRDQNRSADASRTSGNFEFALFDRDTREWVRVANMSGSSVAIREEPNEFTEIVIGHEGVDFVGYAGAGNSEELFRFNLDDSSVDDVPLRDVLEHVTGVWLVNQGDAGLTALHDWVEVTGTGSGATVPDVAEVAAALDAATRSVSVGGPDADRAALVALYEATDGPNWTNNDGWLTDAPVHDWHGVDETDGRGRVRALHLDENNLSGEIPPEIGNLSALRRLFVSRNRLVGSIPAEIGNLSALESLSAEGNELTGEIPPELGALSNLRYLGLLKNELTGAIPAELGDLTALLDLELYSNRLTGEIPPELGGLANLNSLNLALNELSGRLPATFLNLSLARFWWNENAALCAPDTSAFRTWLAGIGDHHPGPFCVEGPEAVGTVPAQVVSVGQSATVDVSPYFRDSDGDPLTYTALSGNAAVVTASMSGSALTVTGAARGRATIAVKATDPAGLSATQTVAVTVTTPNRAPQPVGTIPAMRLSVGGSGSVDVSSYFRDPDGDALTYATSSSNVRVATATMSGTVLTVTGAGVGSATVTVTAADPAGLAAAQTVAVRVGNRAPQPVGTIPAISLTVGASHTLDASVYFRDPDGDALAYRVRSTIPGVAAASVSGRIVTIAGVSLGRATLTLTAVDPAGLTATQTVAVAVVQTANRPPQVRSGLRIEGLPAGQSHMHDMVEGRHFIDPDGDVLSFAAVSRNPDIVDGTMDGNVLTVTGVAPGEGVVAVTATDPAGLSATLDVEVLVIESDNRAPEAVGTIPDQTLEYGEETSLDISSYFRDPDGDPLTFTASSSDDDVVVATMWEQNNRLLVLNAGSEEDGTVTVTVTATDPGGLTATQTVSVTVG
ncbi:MAG: hypothetical protein F4Z72_14620 [Gemmatimonadales bacterium]|nr:hypothetical protein [Candidatus Palauibacter irciniicola]